MFQALYAEFSRLLILLPSGFGEADLKPYYVAPRHLEVGLLAGFLPRVVVKGLAFIV